MCTQTDGHLSLSSRETFKGVRLKNKKKVNLIVNRWFFRRKKRRLCCINSLFLLIMGLLATCSDGEIIGIFSIGIDLFGEDVWGICIGP